MPAVLAERFMQKNNAYNLIYYPEIASTSTFAMQNISSFQDKDVLMAEIQTQGRGRFDRKWISDKPENIYISFVLKPAILLDKPSPLNNISQYLSLKVCELLEEYGTKSFIKWPNDVIVNNKKISGILAQTSIKGNSFQGLVLGIGVNLNFEQHEMESIDRPATSLNLILGQKVDRDKFLEKLLDKFFEEYEMFLREGFVSIKSDYESRAYFLGKEITVSTYQKEFFGKAIKINDDGSLLLEKLPEKELCTINMGEILEF